MPACWVSQSNKCFCAVQNLSCGKRKKVTSHMVATTEISKLSGMSPGPFKAFDYVSFLLIILWSMSAMMLNMLNSSHFVANDCLVFAIGDFLIWALKSDCYCLYPNLRPYMLMCRRPPAPHQFRPTFCQSCSSSNPGPSLASPMT